MAGALRSIPRVYTVSSEWFRKYQPRCHLSDLDTPDDFEEAELVIVVMSEKSVATSISMDPASHARIAVLMDKLAYHIGL